MRFYALASLAVFFIATPVCAETQTRCGWLNNPTPNNFWLDDAEASWLVSMQGGIDGAFFLDEHDPVRIAESQRQDAVQDHLPNFQKNKTYWVYSNVGSYGFGCACLTGSFDEENHVVMALSHSKPLPLSRCYSDKNLPRPD